MLGGGNADKILAEIPTMGLGEDDVGEDEESAGGLESVAADLSVALKDNRPQAAAEALRRAIEIVIAEQ